MSDYKWKGMPEWVERASRDPKYNSVTVIASNDMTLGFEQLAELSSAFGTTKIDFTRYNDDGGCESCGWGGTAGFIEIDVSDVTTWPLEIT